MLFPPMEPLTLVTWNVRYFGHGTRGLRATEAGFRGVARALAGLPSQPDLVCLQEVETTSLRSGDARPQLERLMDELHAELERRGRSRRYQALYYPAHRYETPWAPIYTTGLAVLVAEPLEILAHNAGQPHDVTHVRFRWNRIKQRRIAAHARVRSPGGPALDVFNTHLSLPAFLTRDLYRLPWRMGWGPNQVEEARALLSFVEATRSGPAVLVGDFNSLPGSPTYDALLAAGFADAFPSHVPPARLATWSTNGVGALRMHLDHVLHTDGVRWLDFDGSHAFGEPGPFDGISDHVPKVGRLSLG
jgi:endonuclease/exonuclease/phosphatase family metal-dependent hydrolase